MQKMFPFEDIIMKRASMKLSGTSLYTAAFPDIVREIKKFRVISAVNYTLGKKGCYNPIEDNKTNVDRTFVFPLG